MSEYMTTTATWTPIHLALSLLVEPGLVVELRALSGRCSGVYLTLNPVDSSLLARAHNRVREYVKQGQASKDSDILHRVHFGIDFDPVRPAGISSDDAEHQAALAQARRCREWLKGQGWPDPIYADSGNGAHLVYRVDLPNDVQASEMLSKCLEALATRFDEAAVIVDKTTFNASRIWKLYGTLARKGDALPDRPHHIAAILEAPEKLEPVPADMLEQLAAMVPEPARSTASAGDPG